MHSAFKIMKYMFYLDQCLLVGEELYLTNKFKANVISSLV